MGARLRAGRWASEGRKSIAFEDLLELGRPATTAQDRENPVVVQLEPAR
jgi:hypothetical protein